MPISHRRLLIAKNKVSRKLKAIQTARRRAEAADRKKEEELSKNRRRWEREQKAKARIGSRIAVCGINFYTENSGWRTCHTCGKPLHFFDSHEEANSGNAGCFKYARNSP